MSGSPSGLIPRTNNSSLGLGAAGGPRGFAAGTTQVLVNFLLNYDGEALKRLAADLQKNQVAQSQHAKYMATFQAQQKAVTQSILQIDQARVRIAQTGSATAKNTLQLLADQGKAQRVGLQLTTQQAAQLHQNLADLERNHIINQQDIGLLQNEVRLRQAAASINDTINGGTERQIALEEEKIALLRAEESIRSKAGAGASRIGSLTLGLIGGTIGGALVTGGLLGPLQSALEIVGKDLTNLIAPGNKASEVLSDVADQIDRLKKAGDLTSLQAAEKLLSNLDLPTNLAPRLESAGTLQSLKEESDARQKVIDYIKGQDAVLGELTIQRARENADVDRLTGAYQELGIAERFGADQAALHNAFQSDTSRALGNVIPGFAQLSLLLDGTDWAHYTSGALEGASALEDTAAAAQNAADYIRQLQQESIDAAVALSTSFPINAATAALDDFKRQAIDTASAAISGINHTFDRITAGIQASADARIEGLQKRLQGLTLQPSGQTKSLERQLDALKDAGPSKQTQELTNKIEALNKAQAKHAYQQQLEDINEQIHQARLKQTLALQNQQIDLDKYKGKDRLIAIDALLDRMQKQNEAQQRFNQLLDIQYKIQTGVHREQGETIQDFIARRAQYYRGLLQQAAELRQQGPLQDLQDEKERVAASIDLKDLEAKKRQVIEDHARAAYLKSLQDQLRASQERDQKELESRREALQKQLEASKKADQAALDSKKRALQEEIDRVRANADQQIEQANALRDKEIAAQEATRDSAIATAERVTDLKIQQLQIQADQVKKWTQYANIQALDEAIKGVSSMAQLQALSGAISGLSWTMNYLAQTGAWMGMDPAARQTLLTNYGNLIRDYTRSANQLYQSVNPPARVNTPNAAGGGFADGGVFWANNSNTPLRGDVRWGDGQGDEIGVILSNKVLHTLREQGMNNALIGGDMIIQTGEDPYRARANWRREVKDIIREELRH